VRGRKRRDAGNLSASDGQTDEWEFVVKTEQPPGST
jgi:hypothetical protein